MLSRKVSFVVFVGLAASVLAPCALAAESDTGSPWQLGAGYWVMLGDGEPSNDITSYGFSLRYSLSPNWAVGANLRSGHWDLERPARSLGIVQAAGTEPVDNLVAEEILELWAERVLGPVWGGEVFWQFGAAATSSSARAARGPTASGGRFDIAADVGTTPILTTALGLRRTIGTNWFWQAQLRLEHRFGDVRLTDSISGRSRVVDNDLLKGGFIGIGYRF